MFDDRCLAEQTPSRRSHWSTLRATDPTEADRPPEEWTQEAAERNRRWVSDGTAAISACADGFEQCAVAFVCASNELKELKTNRRVVAGDGVRGERTESVDEEMALVGTAVLHSLHADQTRADFELRADVPHVLVHGERVRGQRDRSDEFGGLLRRFDVLGLEVGGVSGMFESTEGAQRVRARRRRGEKMVEHVDQNGSEGPGTELRGNTRQTRRAQVRTGETVNIYIECQLVDFFDIDTRNARMSSDRRE